MAKNACFALATFVLTAAALEVVSLVFIQTHAKKHAGHLIRPDFEGRLARLTAAEIERYRHGHDGELGWDVRPGRIRSRANTAGEPWSYEIDPIGARADALPAWSAVISAFGDSYTFGHEVDDGETWPHYLSELTGSRVLNFGVGAYGADQALLKLQRTIKNGVTTPIVILAVWSGGLDRLLNAYRPFYRPETGLVLGFKPMLAERGGGDYVWLPNPLPSLRDGGDALAALERAAADDHWLRARVVPDRFPYTLRILQFAGAAVRDGDRRPDRPWSDERVTGRLAFLIRSLHRHARKHGYRPVVVFIPTAGELRSRPSGGEAPHAPFLAKIARRYDGSGMVLVDLYAAEFDERRFNISDRGGHLSPYGNRIVAREIHRAVAPLLTERASTNVAEGS